VARTQPVLLITVIPAGAPAQRLDLTDKVLSFSYEDCEAKADKLSLTVANYDLRNFDDPIWAKGNIVEATWGYVEALAPVRRCRIQKVTGFQELKIDALGIELGFNAVVRSRTFENMTRSEIVRQIAREAGYRSEELLHIEDTKVRFPHVHQGKLTDAQFIRRLAHMEGAEWYIDFDGFHFHRRHLTQQATRVLEWRVPTGDTQLEIISINVENDITGKPGAVTVKSHDPVERKGVSKRASNDTETKRGVLATYIELPGLQSDPDIISSTPPAVTPGCVPQEEVLMCAETDEQAAKRLAAARFRKTQQRAVQMKIEMVGDPNLLAKSVVELRGVGKRLSQRYYVKMVRHTIQDGYKCDLELISDGTGGHDTKSTLAKELGPIQVGGAKAKAKGKQGPPAERNGLKKPGTTPAPPVLKEKLSSDDEGPLMSFQDERARETPSDALASEDAGEDPSLSSSPEDTEGDGDDVASDDAGNDGDEGQGDDEAAE
jgi:phage protein D